MNLDLIKKTIFIRAWALVKVPMIAWLRPKVLEMSDHKVEIAIPLSRRSKNHLNSMYFGALAAGADVAAGVAAVSEIIKSKQKISFAFKSLRAEFFKRAEDQTHFVCTQPKEVAALVTKAIASGEREEMPIKVTAYTPRKFAEEAVAEFELVLSMRRK